MSQDKLYRYLFEQADVRGEIVQLEQSYQQVLAAKAYPDAVARLLGEMLAATSLLTAILKFEGEIAVQLQGSGPVKLVAVNGNHNQQLRAIARWEGDPEGDLKQMVGQGQLVITITPDEGERYQGIVGLEQATLAGCLEQYFAQSEQLKTRLWLHTDALHAVGMLLQALPDSGKDQEVEFEHLESLTDTIKAEELFSLDAKQVLHRLYHQEELRLFDPTEVSFKCGCSRERSLAALSTLPREDLESVLEEQGQIALHCDYCGADYRFDRIDIEALWAGSAGSSAQSH
ncbi:Hsp33 family molecular chaperone HslO [Ferrimonas sediminicola]|uniref:33 kDa chaperonin n=1 Tax=Ferrimonas sediminicola TaxID=2569538 RepID=A0A4U1BB35_9GAMM|nr:Hsp33 family molecular chaperone HslO [Ferrimonas sediminicola]TKB47637.1 Hsp33 family molecular chaperone HslO [Ferrimonas sediminicola]